ncbi:PilT/PilU family type 4a pilus ATPase [Thiofilum flexile]|uniref:PilT/PilU family type 4a pilus ATPase n=1 Tax=Thiofilum flexile TaxID=125627 RepID=UPI000362124F|nr:PilT/PilU family type 4a pilus ATPase [Thiofilum flexile]
MIAETIIMNADMRITPLLHMMVKLQASDLYLTTGAYASLKVRGQLQRITRDPLRPGNIRQLAEEVLTRSEIEQFFTQRELNKALTLKDIGRFRMNLYFQRGEVSMVIRHIRNRVANPDDLGLPPVLKQMVMGRDGLVLFVGTTGSGKSTSMAALIQYRNERHPGHILTIEDPIEYTFTHGQSIIGQREVGFDTLSYSNAMREAMREAPDMIMVGEARDLETMDAVLGFADTGHLVLSTLHAANTVQALERILYMFPNDTKNRLLMDLSLNLRCIIAQRLVPGLEEDKVYLATEVLINTPYVAELIRKGKISELREVVEKGSADGMQSFDASLLQLYQQGKISHTRALEFASSKNNLEWQLNFGDTEPTNTASRPRSDESMPILDVGLDDLGGFNVLEPVTVTP